MKGKNADYTIFDDPSGYKPGDDGSSAPSKVTLDTLFGAKVIVHEGLKNIGKEILLANIAMSGVAEGWAKGAAAMEESKAKFDSLAQALKDLPHLPDDGVTVGFKVPLMTSSGNSGGGAQNHTPPAPLVSELLIARIKSTIEVDTAVACLIVNEIKSLTVGNPKKITFDYTSPVHYTKKQTSATLSMGGDQIVLIHREAENNGPSMTVNSVTMKHLGARVDTLSAEAKAQIPLLNEGTPKKWAKLADSLKPMKQDVLYGMKGLIDITKLGDENKSYVSVKTPKKYGGITPPSPFVVMDEPALDKLDDDELATLQRLQAKMKGHATPATKRSRIVGPTVRKIELPEE